MWPQEITSFAEHLRARHYSPHTVLNYELDLRLFFGAAGKEPDEVTWRDVDRFIVQQHERGLAATTINRRLNAVRSFYEFLMPERDGDLITPIKPSHFLRQGRPLPKKLTGEEVRHLFAQITNRMDRALFLLMLRCGLRVSEVAALKLTDLDWEEKAVLVRQGKGRKDRRVYLSPDAAAGLSECRGLRPETVTGDRFFWNQKRPRQLLSVKAIQKKMERYARAAGVKASCHSLRHTFASNLLEAGAEVVSIREFLGHANIASSERYAKLSNLKVKQVYLQAIAKVVSKTRV
jgi:site-specific recombinase XerD